MSTLDSRSLQYVDCFGQKFTSPGTVRYRLTTAAGADLPVEEDAEEETFTIEVKDEPRIQAGERREGKQHQVSVRQEEGPEPVYEAGAPGRQRRRRGKRLVADPPRLEIAVGDVVLWNSPEPSPPGFAVRGEGENYTFDSTSLVSECVYTHAFGTPGDYEWVDANGGRVSGVVRVRSLDANDKAERKRWLAAMRDGALIVITDDQAEPDQIDIVAGQTVFWAVQQASGITVTDARLMQGAEEAQADTDTAG
jgi:plastocyanin